jgi:hypothetical protein
VTEAHPGCFACPGWADKDRALFNARGAFKIEERNEIVEWLREESERLDQPALYAAAERIAHHAHKVKR